MTDHLHSQRVITILADGARADVMRELLASGDLPNIARYLVEPGSILDAVTSFPSTTGPAYLPYLTGCLPGTCNVPGIRWFDKTLYASGRSFDRYRSYVGLESFCMAGDMQKQIRTIFELVPDSWNVFNPIARGAGRRNATRISRIWYWYYAHLTDRWAFADEAGLAKIRRVLARRRPRFLFAVFPGIDEYSHLIHPRDPKTIERYRWLDHAVGEIVADLKRDGAWECTSLFIVSDHGLSKTDAHFCVNTFLEGRGMPAFFYPCIFDKKGKRSANMVSGNGMTHLYFKNSDGWSRRTTRGELERMSPGFVEALQQEDAIDLVICRNEEGGADVLSRRGEACVRLDGDRLHYEVLSTDPFGYGPMPTALTSRDCLKQTWNSAYPDAPFQIAHLLTAARSGDLLLSATPGFDLRLKYEHPEHHGSHGSLHESHMRVPILTNRRFAEEPMRTVDLFPTILSLLGEPLPAYLDGQPL